MPTPTSSNNDPTPHERKGDAAFLPVVIAFAVTIVAILVAALLFIKARQARVIPGKHDPHPTSQVWQPQGTDRALWS